MKLQRSHRIPSRERGAVLAIGLIILVIMTLLGVTAMSTTSLENKMAGNLKDWNLALQAAEAGLRDAETDIVTTGRVSGLTNVTAGCFAVMSGTPDERDGQCQSAAGDTTNIWQTINWADGAVPQKYVKYGSNTLLTQNPPVYTAAQGYAALPRYILQPVSDLGRPGKSLVGPAESNKTKTTRIIAVGYGGSAQASVMLQSTYILPF